MRHLMMTMGLALGMLVSSASANTVATFDQIAAEAQKVRVEAQEVKQLLKAKKPDFALVQQRLDALETHAQALRQSMSAVDAAAAMTPAQTAALERARAATDTLLVMLDNKATMLADAEAATRQRGLLRAKADGIAKRAGIVEKQMAQLRS